MARVDLRRLERFVDRIGFLGAPVPSTSTYDNDQAAIFKSPETIEAEFSRTQGKDIPKEYVERLQQFLEDIHSYIISNERGIQSFACNIVKASIGNHGNRVEFHVVTVRPCAERMGILGLVTFQVLKSAASCNKFVMAVLPVDKIASMVKTLSPNDTSINPSIDVDIIQTITPETLKIGHLITEQTGGSGVIQLNSEKFPSAHDMNNPEAVRQRLMSRASHLIRDGSVSM
jgi:hypothetical protein